MTLWVIVQNLTSFYSAAKSISFSQLINENENYQDRMQLSVFFNQKLF